MLLTPWDLDRVLEADEHAGSGPRLGLHVEQVSAVEGGGAADLVAVASREAWANVLLPDPLGPMMAWTSPAPTSRSSPLRIGVSADRGGEVFDVQHQPTLPSRLTLRRR